MCKVKGKLKKVFRNPQWAQECPKELDEKDRNFESEAVCKRKNTKGELLDSVIHVSNTSSYCCPPQASFLLMVSTFPN